MQIITLHTLPAEVYCTATIGFFDGVHSGHRYLLDQLKAAASEQKQATLVVTFRRHPRQVLDTNYRPLLLLDYDEKIEHLAQCGIDYCLPLDFTPELAALTARQFMEQYLYARLHVRQLLLGYDHHFGSDRCSFKEYLQIGRETGIRIIKSHAFTPQDTCISSSAIRRFLQAGNVESARWALGYPFALYGTVVEGHRLGRQLGFPTANILPDSPEKIIPADGVYAVRAETDDQQYDAMLNIGRRPTVDNGNDRTIEAHLFHFNGNLYGQHMQLHFIGRLREEIQFDSIGQLQAQLQHDAQQALQILHS